MKKELEKKIKTKDIKHDAKIISFTLLFFIVAALIIGVIFFIFEISKKADELSFAFNHPTLVRELKKQYESKTNEVEKGLLVKEKSTDDKLKDALISQLEQSKN